MVKRLRITVTPGPLSTPCYVTGLSGQRYAQVKLRRADGTWRNGSAHRWVWETLNGPVPEGMHVCHRCDVPKCVNPGHLYVGTPERNVQDQVDRNRRPRGAAINTAVLSADDVRAIRASTEGAVTLARRYGVSAQQVWRIRTGQSWRHV